MKIHNKYKTCIFVLFLFILLVVLFIFTNSMKSREASSHDSTSIAEVLKSIFDPNDKIPMETFHNTIRKIAHFVEFSTLGFLIMGLFLAVFFKRRKAFLISAPSCFVIASIDETIQIFSHRGSSIKDVALDFAGALFGIAIMTLFICIIRNKRKKKNSQNEKDRTEI